MPRQLLEVEGLLVRTLFNAGRSSNREDRTSQNILDDPYIALSWDNLEALCQDCHNKEHHRKDKKKRYAFDEAGNLISPPIRSKFREGSTPRAGD